MLLTTIMHLLVAFSLLQVTTTRFFVAITFSLVTLTHDIIFSDLVGLGYYGSAALANLLIIILTSGVAPVITTTIKIHMVCLISIIVNGLGWLTWFFYLPPDLYNITFLAIYAWVVRIFIEKDNEHVGGNTMLEWRFNFRSYISAWTRYIQIDKS